MASAACTVTLVYGRMKPLKIQRNSKRSRFDRWPAASVSDRIDRTTENTEGMENEMGRAVVQSLSLPRTLTALKQHHGAVRLEYRSARNEVCITANVGEFEGECFINLADFHREVDDILDLEIAGLVAATATAAGN